MSTIDRAALIEQAASAYVDGAAKVLDIIEGRPIVTWADVDERTRTGIRGSILHTLPVVAKALLAPLRELHYAAYQDANRNPICPDCQGRAGTHPCGCWSKYDTVPVCGVCWEGWKFIAVTWPCPTVRLLDAIEAEVQS